MTPDRPIACIAARRTVATFTELHRLVFVNFVTFMAFVSTRQLKRKKKTVKDGVIKLHVRTNDTTPHFRGFNWSNGQNLYFWKA